MEFVIRAAFVYFFLLLLFSISGKRSMAQIDTFDFILLLIISEATQQALIGQDYSLTTAAVVIATLFLIDVAFTSVKQRWPILERLTSGMPIIIVQNGQPIREHLEREHVDVAEILTAARKSHGIERLEQIKFAVLEIGGEISIIPDKSKEEKAA